MKNDAAPRATTGQLVVRMTPDLLAALDRRVAAEQASAPGRCVNRSEVVRAMLWAALADPPKRPKRVARGRPR